LLGGEDKGDGGVLLEQGDILKRVFFHMSIAQQKLKEDADDYYDLVGLPWRFVEISPHLKKKRGQKGRPISRCLF
jgi:hypothetical protein